MDITIIKSVGELSEVIEVKGITLNSALDVINFIDNILTIKSNLKE